VSDSPNEPNSAWSVIQGTTFSRQTSGLLSDTATTRHCGWETLLREAQLAASPARAHQDCAMTTRIAKPIQLFAGVSQPTPFETGLLGSPGDHVFIGIQLDAVASLLERRAWFLEWLPRFKRANLGDGFAHPFETTHETVGEFVDKPEVESCLVRVNCCQIANALTDRAHTVGTYIMTGVRRLPERQRRGLPGFGV
jgi:hypothetical protein